MTGLLYQPWSVLPEDHLWPRIGPLIDFPFTINLAADNEAPDKCAWLLNSKSGDGN